MKKLSVFLSIFMLASLILAACNAGGNQPERGEGTESAEENQPAATALLPSTGGTATSMPASTLPAATESASTMPAATLPAGTAVMITPPIMATSTISVPAATSLVTQSPLVMATASPLSTETNGLRGATILPNTGRLEATKLSALLTYKVMDMNNQTIGTINDYVLNMCEGFVVYMVVNTEGNLGLKGGNRLLIPYEAVTLRNGVVDVNNKAIVLKSMDAKQLANAPAFNGNLNLANTDWESAVQSFWSQGGKLSLSSTCRPTSDTGTGSTASDTTNTTKGGLPVSTETAGQSVATVTKIGFAKQLLHAQLVDGNKKPLGQVQEITLEPESGHLRWVVVKPEAGLQMSKPGLVALPIRALNLGPLGANGMTDYSGAPVLVLLVDQSVLTGAPVYNAIPDTSSPNWEGNLYQYWSKYVPGLNTGSNTSP